MSRSARLDMNATWHDAAIYDGTLPRHATYNLRGGNPLNKDAHERDHQASHSRAPLAEGVVRSEPVIPKALPGPQFFELRDAIMNVKSAAHSTPVMRLRGGVVNRSGSSVATGKGVAALGMRAARVMYV